MSHGSARLTVHGRRLIVQRHQAGWPQAHIAAAMGVSRKCVKTWIARFAAEGEAGLVDRSSRPHTMPTRTSDEVEQRVLAARTRHRDGPDCARSEGRGARADGVADPAPSRRAVSAPVRSDHRRGDPLVEDDRGPLRARTARRAGAHGRQEARARSPTAAAGGRTAAEPGRSCATATTKVGFDYVHSLVDDHIRLAYSEVLPDEKGADQRRVPRPRDRLLRRPRHHQDRAADHRQRVGLPIRRCARSAPPHGIQQKFIKPHCPWQNGKVERFNRTLATEWAYRQVFTSNQDRTAALAPWLEHYNTERRHSALGRQPTNQPAAHQPDGRVHLGAPRQPAGAGCRVRLGGGSCGRHRGAGGSARLSVRNPRDASGQLKVSVARIGSGDTLLVDVDPDRTSGYWSFQVQELGKDGAWWNECATWATEGSAETRALPLGAGAYRVVVLGKDGWTGTTSARVSLTGARGLGMPTRHRRRPRRAPPATAGGGSAPATATGGSPSAVVRPATVVVRATAARHRSRFVVDDDPNTAGSPGTTRSQVRTPRHLSRGVRCNLWGRHLPGSRAG